MKGGYMVQLRIASYDKAVVVVDENERLIFTASGVYLKQVQEIIHKVNNYDEMFQKYEEAIDDFYELGYTASDDLKCLNKFRFE
jgi:hypothetical protein